MSKLWNKFKWHGICVIGVPKEVSETGTKNVFEVITANNFSKFDEKYKSTVPTSWMNPKQKNHEGNSIKAYHIQIVQIPVIKGKSSKEPERRNTLAKGQR